MKLPALLALLAGAAAAHAQPRHLFADRGANVLWMIDDLDASGLIDEPGEIWTYFSTANAAGTLGIDNPNCLTVRADGLAAIGDQLTTSVYLFHDLNKDGDCQDIGESVVAAGPGNGSVISLAFPTGLAFDPAGVLYVVNAGNSFGADAIYRFVDLDADGRFQSANEIQPYVTTGAFGATPNGPYSPQEIFFTGTAADPVGFLRNSSSNLNGVFRFVDLDHSGRADDPGEFTAYWDATGASGVAPLAGFALEPDAARLGSMYALQTATGGVDQIVRLTDLNHDDDAQDPGEAILVYSNAAAGFTGIDLVSLADGRVLITDNSGHKVFVLTDLDADDRFLSAGEQTVLFNNTLLLAGEVRPLAPIARVCQANCDDSTTPPALNVLDFACFLNKFAAGNLYANCDSSTTPPILNVLDFACFLNKFAAGCP